MRALNSFPYFALPAIAALALISSSGWASTIWNGPSIGFFHNDANHLADALATDVSITRPSTGGGLYNPSMGESGPVPNTSPKGTAWAVGTLATFASNPGSLVFGPCPLEAGGHPPGNLNKTYVVHLTSASDDIYLQLTLTNWGAAGGFGDHTFGYIRTTPGAVVPPTPTVSITNPVTGSVFAGPTNLSIRASATVSSGTVTNVQFFTNNVLLRSVTAAPFTTVATNLALGAYALKAVATAAGISGTSAVVNITVVATPTISITNPVSGAVFANPADVRVGANAAVSPGTVTNVQFFTNGVPFKSVTASPFLVTVANLVAGTYGFTAAATASGISATSAPVNISVVNPVPVNISAPVVGGGQFSFNFNVNTGLTYVVLGSSNLLNWVPAVTNTPSVSPVPFSNPVTNPAQYYRISLLPNP